MSAGWKIFGLSAIVFAIAFTVGRLLVPDIGPIAYAEQPQPSWAVMTAFGLRAVELTAAWIAIMSLSITTGAWVKARLGRLFSDAPSHPSSQTDEPPRI
jgi:hypothetical protein